MAVPTIPEFVKRCDAYCDSAGVSRTWLSKRLFADTYRIDDLASDKSDVGVKRMLRAERELRSLEASLNRGHPTGEAAA